jgi:glutamate synthase (NADPH/NADH) large chain
MARQCHKNTCPVGVATQREDLRERYPGQPEHTINYFTFMAQELREIMAELGCRELEEMVGRVDLLSQRDDVEHPKAKHLDLSAILAHPSTDDDRVKTREQNHDVDDQLDWDLIEQAEPALDRREAVHLESDITNADRAVGATLSHAVSSAYGPEGLPEDTIAVDLEGTAGQSFGAFLQTGVAMHLTGSANDYVGKGLSGGKLSITTPAHAGYDPAENVCIGNVALYGATQGEAYVNGQAGERFAVRNSGVRAVVEGVGDHGCEYMTGGAVAVLGPTGKNFAAGMSGGIAYVLTGPGEETGLAGSVDFADRVNPDMVTLYDDLDEADERLLRRMIENHAAYTGSEKANAILANWKTVRSRFVKVMPQAYERVLTEEGRADVRDSVPASAAVDASGDVAAVGSGDD